MSDFGGGIQPTPKSKIKSCKIKLVYRNSKHLYGWTQMIVLNIKILSKINSIYRFPQKNKENCFKEMSYTDERYCMLVFLNNQRKAHSISIHQNFLRTQKNKLIWSNKKNVPRLFTVFHCEISPSILFVKITIENVIKIK